MASMSKMPKMHNLLETEQGSIDNRLDIDESSSTQREIAYFNSKECMMHLGFMHWYWSKQTFSGS